MRQNPKTLRAFIGEVTLLLTSIRRHRPSDGLVKTAVEYVKVLDADRGVRLACQVGDDLADVSVAIHDLRDGEAIPQQLTAMERGSIGNRLRGVARADQTQSIVGRADLGQRSDELGQKNRDPMLEFRVCRSRGRPLAYALPSAADYLLAVGNDEVVESNGRHGA